MSLPDLIEIVPLDKPVRAEITVPGSKSITNRALILAALADGEITLEGELGYKVDSPNDKLPATIHGRDGFHPVPNRKGKVGDGVEPVPTRSCTVSIAESSQFASALILCSLKGGWQISVTGENMEESPY